MKLLGITALLGMATGDQMGNLEVTLTRKYSQFTSFKQSSVDGQFLAEVDEHLKSDTLNHNRVKGVRGIKLMPEPGNCGLHWSLCPNMCNLNETLSNEFNKIRGNKMTKYNEWKTETALKKRAIIKDLEGKLDQVEGLEEELRKNGVDLETRQELFIALLEDHIAKGIVIKEDLEGLKDDFDDIGTELVDLSGKVEAAHTDCYDQAPCMAVPQCKLGVASGESCADIASNAMDVDQQGDATLNLETSSIHIIQPSGLEAKAAICEFDFTGTGFTVVQNRHNDTGSFGGDYENGFGTTVGYDDAACAPANYYLGNEYVRAITKSGSSLKVKHAQGQQVSVEQWNTVSVRNDDNIQLGNGGHVCGSNTMAKGDVRLKNGGINGRWTGQTQIMIGKDNSPDQDNDCITDYGGGSYDSGKGSSDYGSSSAYGN